MPQSATFDVGFESPECSGGQLVLEDEGTIRLGDQAINFVRVFPAVPAKMRVRGNASVAYYNTDAIQRHDIIQLSGTRAAIRTPRKWVDPCHTRAGLPPSPWSGLSTGGLGGGAGVSIEVLESFDAETGSAFIPALHFDADSNEIVADKDVYAILDVHYLAACNRYRVTRSGDAIKADAGVVAFYRGQFAETTLPSITPDYIDVYRVTSEYIADLNGQWEVPHNSTGWPEDNTYDDAPGADPLPDNGTYQELRRPHEVARMSDRGDLEFIKTLDKEANPLQPFDGGGGLGTYIRDFSFREQPAPDEESIFWDAWQNLDFDTLYNNTKARFPDIVRVTP